MSPRIKKLALGLTILIVGLGLAGVLWSVLHGGGPSGYAIAQSERKRQLAPQVDAVKLDALVAGNTQFGLDLYRILRREGGNLFFSPYSISLALAMVHAGARGNTATEMARALHFTLEQDALHPAFNVLDLDLAGLSDNPAVGGRLQLDIANALWGQSGWSFLPEFLDVLAENYGAGIQLLDLTGAPNEARLIINEWVLRKTLGKIDSLLSPGAIGSLTELVLTNAIYFNATWEYRFDRRLTNSDGTFYPLDGRQVTVPMMEQLAPLGYAEGAGFRAVELPYCGEMLSMVALLPDRERFEAFAEELDAERVDDLLDQIVRQERVHLRMPRFEFESGFRLGSALTGLGMVTAFTEAADFSGMDGNHELFIGDVFHSAFVSVDEDGTEAGASTAVSMERSQPRVFTITLNRPFIFLIVHNKTRTVLLMGQVMDPREG